MRAVILLFIALTLSPGLPAAGQPENDTAAIQALVVAWGTALEAENVAGVVALYTDNIVRMAPDMPTVRGKQAISEFYRGVFELFSVGLIWPVEGTEEIIVADGWAFHISEYILKITPKAGGETIEEHGKIVEICRRQTNGSWKFAREIWNRNSPPGKE